ncbi:multidrug efflux pump subunit AcrA (membrane-fusion protein) [Sphingomonas jejuensis]|uniref:Multidrug efflux pump subunit AcrA (Membrane-fusion protein) n=1 Tax=Sphingomonas jejuensis TaxID=904715 RepID=A0ABX0XLY1_9SPHN|nr:HlyD family efflux transporter periplasmic adaptor subunit [Sphingomonas jejuensis]NJC34245.1 multidrug efflux pump subunit AcrA (membrane-fusion protein) [Sphingomonas jejuensis]
MPDRPQHLAHFTTLASMKPPAVTRVLAWLVMLGIAIAVGILVFVPWVQTAQGQGQVIALDPDDRARSVSSLISGRVEQFYVRDGQHVDAGDPIVRIVDVDPGLLDRLRAERRQIEAQIAAIQQARSVAQIDVDRSRQLMVEGLGSRRDFEQAQIRVASEGARLAEARAGINRIDTELNRQSAQIVRAPRDGRVQQINAAIGGALISAGDVVAVIAPERVDRAVEIYVDGRDVPLIRAGRPVRLEFEGFPAIQFSGWPAIAQGVFDGRVRNVDPTAQPSGLFRVLVEERPGGRPWPDQRFVRQGGKVLGWVQGETVSVGYELWRQLNDFPLNFGQPPAAAATGNSSGSAAGGSGGASGSADPSY